ncbi:MAG: Dipeptide transport system permease protein DppB [Anaerolineales bacterium]|nr:Dipeptide transport system permease protein DppB [Anaerolineales bacterium]
MTKYIVRRILWFMPVLFSIALVTFILARALPGGPFDFAGDRTIPASIVANLERKYHLDWPVWKQFASYLWDLVRLDLGPSFHFRNRTVNDILAQTFPISFQLGVLAILLGLVIGVPAGTFAALKQNTWVDYSSSFIAIIGVSVPNIVLGPFLVWALAIKLGWFPAARWGIDYTDLYLGVIPPPTIKFLKHAVLPVVTLGTGQAAVFARLTRGSLLQVIREDYIRTARAKGLRERTVIVGHALKNSLIPVVTILGPLFAAIVTGTFVVERIFGIPGMGTHFITSVNNRDYPVVMGTALVYAVLLVVANLLVDITYAWLDPRIRYE